MGLREFRDSEGVVWQVWTVTADVLDKRTTAEDYMREWQDGWLCFEHSGARRRLAQFPADWEAMPDEKLQLLLDQAQPVKPRKGSTSGEYPATGEHASPSARTSPDEDRPEQSAP